jgi:HdeA/HdeB family protein
MNRRGALRWAAIGCLLAVSAPRAEEEAKPKRVDIKNLSCEDFLALPADVQPVVVAWVHGYTRAGGENWVFQAGEGKAFIASVEEKCTKSPKASFRYQVLETAKERQAAARAKAAKK